MLTEVCNCPICGFSSNHPFAFEEYEIKSETVHLGVNRCKNCHMVYISPRLNHTGLVYLYDNLYDSASPSGRNCIDESISYKEYRAFYKYALSFRPQGGSLLDMGCGVGNFLMQFKDNLAFAVHGVEISKFAAGEAQKRGLQVIHGDAQATKLPPASFDLISMLYILEHVADPVGLLQESNRLLRPGGIAMIAVPNYHYLRLLFTGPVCRLIFKKPTRLHAQEHLQNFTPYTLSLAVKKADLVPLKFFCGSPTAKGNFLVRTIKNCLGLGVKTLFYLGIHLGAIHLLAQKPVKAEGTI